MIGLLVQNTAFGGLAGMALSQTATSNHLLGGKAAMWHSHRH